MSHPDKVDMTGLNMLEQGTLKHLWQETFLAAVRSGMAVYFATVKADEAIKRYRNRFMEKPDDSLSTHTSGK